MSLSLPRLPLDLSTFRTLREEGYLYVDKTQHAYNLITGGRRFFLSRPRRFGKSLLVSTLREILLGNRDLFEGLWIGSSNYAWRPHGVIVLNLSSIGAKNETELECGISQLLAKIARSHGLDVTLGGINPGLDLSDLVEALHNRFKRVAILIDEYDNPILQDLHNLENATNMRNVLHRFFMAIKGLDEFVHFVFITGVSAFAKAGIFSGMNDLQVLTMRDNCADICGYSDIELDHFFNGYIQSWANKQGIQYSEQRQKIKEWYNGYRFSKDKLTVYNPFSLMNALHEQQFENFWFRSGTPTFLIEELKRQQRETPDAFQSILQEDPINLTQGSLGSFDIGSTPLPALMFQAGYLTVTNYNSETNSYQLGYPNHEVEQSLKLYLLSIVSKLDANFSESLALALSAALSKQDVAAAVQVIRQLGTRTPYPLHGENESHYHAMLHMLFTVAGLTAQAEVATRLGRADLVIEMTQVIYIIEIKFTETEAKTSAAKALAQIEQRKYYEQYLHFKKNIILLGISFMRGPSAFEVEYETRTIRP